MDIVEHIGNMQGKEIIIVLSKGEGKNLIVDTFTKGGLILSKTDEMMMRNTSLLSLLDSEDYATAIK